MNEWSSISSSRENLYSASIEITSETLIGSTE